MATKKQYEFSETLLLHYRCWLEEKKQYEEAGIKYTEPLWMPKNAEEREALHRAATKQEAKNE